MRRQKIQAKRDRLNQQAEAAEAKRGRGRDANAVPVGVRKQVATDGAS